jgi:hypothetical protein
MTLDNNKLCTMFLSFTQDRIELYSEWMDGEPLSFCNTKTKKQQEN